MFINKVTLDATCPISKDTDFKKCTVRISKVAMNKAQDAQGYSNHLEDVLGDYMAWSSYMQGESRMEGQRRLAAVDLAVRGLRGDRYGLSSTSGV